MRAAHIMFLASNICCVSSGTVRARYCCEPRDVSGAKPIMKKWRRGKGIMLTAAHRGREHVSAEEGWAAAGGARRVARRVAEGRTELAQVAVELAREAQAARGGRHDRRDEVVEVTEGRGGELEGAEAA